jgi:hypothetical protein
MQVMADFSNGLSVEFAVGLIERFVGLELVVRTTGVVAAVGSAVSRELLVCPPALVLHAGEVFEQRSDVGERYLERLRALLTPEQIERLPRTRGQGGARGGFGGGQGGAEGMQGMLERLPEEQRRQLLQAVDRNGNGQIDEDEREGLRQYMREQFSNFRNNAGGGGGGGAGGRGGRGGAGDA